MDASTWAWRCTYIIATLRVTFKPIFNKTNLLARLEANTKIRQNDLLNQSRCVIPVFASPCGKPAIVRSNLDWTRTNPRPFVWTLRGRRVSTFAQTFGKLNHLTHNDVLNKKVDRSETWNDPRQPFDVLWFISITDRHHLIDCPHLTRYTALIDLNARVNGPLIATAIFWYILQVVENLAWKLRHLSTVFSLKLWFTAQYKCKVHTACIYAFITMQVLHIRITKTSYANRSNDHFAKHYKTWILCSLKHFMNIAVISTKIYEPISKYSKPQVVSRNSIEQNQFTKN